MRFAPPPVAPTGSSGADSIDGAEMPHASEANASGDQAEVHVYLAGMQQRPELTTSMNVRASQCRLVHPFATRQELPADVLRRVEALRCVAMGLGLDLCKERVYWADAASILCEIKELAIDLVGESDQASQPTSRLQKIVSATAEITKAAHRLAAEPNCGLAAAREGAEALDAMRKLTANAAPQASHVGAAPLQAWDNIVEEARGGGVIAACASSVLEGIGAPPIDSDSVAAGSVGGGDETQCMLLASYILGLAPSDLEPHPSSQADTLRAFVEMVGSLPRDSGGSTPATSVICAGLLVTAVCFEGVGIGEAGFSFVTEHFDVGSLHRNIGPCKVLVGVVIVGLVVLITINVIIDSCCY